MISLGYTVHRDRLLLFELHECPFGYQIFVSREAGHMQLVCFVHGYEGAEEYVSVLWHEATGELLSPKYLEAA